jgi:gamma-tubulin complex component 5
LRTNQFEVDGRLTGLVERFRVQHREALADTLSERLDALAHHPSKWHPELLYLLLELADQPAQKTSLDNIDALRELDEEPEPPLKWEDIAREDGWANDPGLWRSVDYSDSSDGEGYRDPDDSSDADTLLSEIYLGRQPEDLIVKSNEGRTLEQVQESQAWRIARPVMDAEGRMRKIPLAEFQAAREVLFMLQGIETSLFDKDVFPVATYQLRGVNWDTYRALITSFSEIGRGLEVLRVFAMRPQSSAHLQVFRDCVQRSLRSFDKQVSSLEARLVTTDKDIVVSLVSIQDELRQSTKPLSALSDIVGQMLEAPNSGAFKYLELLFDEVGMAQLTGNQSIYDSLGRIFFECFQVYLRPIRQWMEEGQLIVGDKLFFVSESPSQVALSQTWNGRYRLRRTPDGRLHAPKFLQPSAARIFTAGKSIVVLKHLGRYQPFGIASWKVEPWLDFDSVCQPGLELSPFAELFTAAFDQWIHSKHQTTSETLKQVLFESCGLWRTLDALDCIYFMSDGAIADLFSVELFGKLERLKANWHDRYALTGLAQEVLASRVDTERISVIVSPKGQQYPLTTARDSIKTALPEVSINYRLAWPVQLIVSDGSVAQFQTVYTLLLQLRRATHSLNKSRTTKTQCAYGADDTEAGLYYLLRAKLLWFCNTFQTYLASLVLAPNTSRMRESLRRSHDVDAMIAVHAGLTKRIIDEACLGSKLSPIRDAILDLLDLTLRLERAQAANAAREAEEMQELTRLSIMSSPMKARPKRGQRREEPDARKEQRYSVESDDEELASPPAEADMEASNGDNKSYAEVLEDIRGDFDKNLKFIVGGLRGVARATSEAASAQWDILAEMLEVGVRGDRSMY